MRRTLIHRNTPPEWNVRVLTLDDFHQYCDEAKITVREAQLEQPGLYMLFDGKPHIFIHEDLRGPERLFVGFHELAHYWLHPLGIQFFRGWERNIETEADVVAACALIPLPTLQHFWPSEIVDLYGYAAELVELRQTIFERWRI